MVEIEQVKEEVEIEQVKEEVEVVEEKEKEEETPSQEKPGKLKIGEWTELMGDDLVMKVGYVDS